MGSKFNFFAALLLICLANPLPAAPYQDMRDSAKSGQQKFYQADSVQTVHLKITESDHHRMIDALPECIYVPASFQWNDVTLERVAVRFKGNSSSHPNQKHKRSYLVRFDKYETNQQFLGLRRVSFDNGVQFGSLFSEPIITEILQAEGITTHRCNYAKVYLNDQYQGVYVNVERIDRTFLERNFPNVSGGLWKNDLGGQGGNLAFIGNETKKYEQTFEAKNKEAKDRGELVGFIRKINQTREEDFANILESTMNVDQLFRVTAIMLLSGAFDQLTGWNPHNFYLFHESERDRWHYFPWDLDVGFCENAFGRLRILEDWNAAWPVPAGCSIPLLDRVLKNPVLLTQYRQIAAEILEERFQPDQLCESIDRKYKLIKGDLVNDPFPKLRATSRENEDYGEIVESMKVFMRKRYVTASHELENPGSRPLLSTGTRSNDRGVPADFMTRIKMVEMNARGMQQRLQQLQKLMQRVNQHLQQGEHAEADKLLKEAIEISRAAGKPIER